MGQAVKCRSCGQATDLEWPEINRLKATSEIEDHGVTGTLRLLSWTCPSCRKAAATAVLGVGLQMRRIAAGIARLRAAGKPVAEAVALAVESQMDEDDRRRFPDFYHWRRER